MTDTEIIADLFKQLMMADERNKDFYTVKVALKRLREAEKAGAEMNGYTATYCYPEHKNYQKFGDLENLE